MKFKMKRLAGLTFALLVFSGSVTNAQQKQQNRPAPVNIVDFAQVELTRKFQKQRKGQPISVTLDTTAHYPVSDTVKGVRGTGTLLTKKTGKEEMFAYDVQFNPRTATPVRTSYSLMKGVVSKKDDSAMEYRMKMAQGAIRSKIQQKEGKNLIVTFKSAIPVPVTAQTTQFKGEGGFSDGKTAKKFKYAATIDGANGKVRGARYEIVADQKVKR